MNIETRRSVAAALAAAVASFMSLDAKQAHAGGNGFSMLVAVTQIKSDNASDMRKLEDTQRDLLRRTQGRLGPRDPVLDGALVELASQVRLRRALGRRLDALAQQIKGGCS